MKNLECGFHCIKASNIGVKIGQEEIIRHVNLHIHCKELTVIIGKNGAGKTTLLKAFLGEVKHTGKIVFTDTKNNMLRKLKIGYVPQSINVEKHMPTTVYDLFASCITYIPVFLRKDKKIYNEIKEHLKVFGADELIDKSIGDLSGGELQRVSIARAICKKPELLLCDEPTGALDSVTGKQILKLIKKMSNEQKITVVLVTHNSKIAKIGNNVLTIKDGQVDKLTHNTSPCPIDRIVW